MPSIPQALAPGWLRPLWLQREVGRAVAARLAWMRAHPDQAAMLHAEDAPSSWSSDDWTPYDRRCLRLWSDEWLAFWWEVNTERLLLLVRVPPALMGEDLWTHVLLGTCEHLAQLYHQFRKRYGARATRRFVRDTLNNYVCWEPKKEAGQEAEEMTAQIDDQSGCLLPA
ncbi:MAG TPA: hypothetical protein VKT82_04015 [Ktedonobacterales bacterium]|nr:hypothetical protein [Ktedonobacterales bacterium]